MAGNTYANRTVKVVQGAKTILNQKDVGLVKLDTGMVCLWNTGNQGGPPVTIIGVGPGTVVHIEEIEDDVPF